MNIPGPVVDQSAAPSTSACALVLEILAEGATPLIRTDFSDDAAWSRLVDEVGKPVLCDEGPGDPTGEADAYTPYVVAVDDRALASVTGARLADELDVDPGLCGYALLADARSMSEAAAGAELTVEYVDLSVFTPEDADLFGSFLGRTFRSAVTEVADIEANLSLSNMDFRDFADNADADGVFRGFPDAG